jgi:ankyrin repeat protein
MDIVKLLLEKGADVNPQGEDSDTPLCSACSGGHMDIVKLLLEKGADVNPQGEYSNTPLRSACYGGHMDIVKLLLEKGADVNLQGKDSNTPLRSACSAVTWTSSSYSLRREQMSIAGPGFRHSPSLGVLSRSHRHRQATP